MTPEQIIKRVFELEFAIIELEQRIRAFKFACQDTTDMEERLQRLIDELDHLNDKM